MEKAVDMAVEKGADWICRSKDLAFTLSSSRAPLFYCETPGHHRLAMLGMCYDIFNSNGEHPELHFETLRHVVSINIVKNAGLGADGIKIHELEEDT